MNSFIIPIVLSSVFFGAVPALDKYAMNSNKITDPTVYTLVRLLSMAFFILFFSLIYFIFYRSKINLNLLKSKTIYITILSALLNASALFFLFFSIFYSKYTSVIAVVGSGLSLLTTILLSYALLNQILNWKLILGFLITIFGIFFTLYYSNT